MVLSINCWNASIVTKRSDSGVSSLQCDKPLVDLAMRRAGHVECKHYAGTPLGVRGHPPRRRRC